MHATYNETITRALNVFEKVNRDIPFSGLHWIFDHCETIDDRNIERIAKLGGGIAVQHRMAYKASTSSLGTVPKRPSGRRPFAGCWTRGCRSALAQMQRVSHRTTRGSHSPGL